MPDQSTGRTDLTRMPEFTTWTGRSPRHWARMHFLGNGQIERAHKYHKITRLGGGSQATGETTLHRQRRHEIRDLHGTFHFTRGIIYT